MSELFRLAKLQGVHTTLDTAGQPYTTAEPFYSKFETLMQNTDLVMLDLKAFYPDRHKALTGCDNTPILDMARWMGEHGKAMWIRHVLVPGLTDDEAELREMSDFIKSLGSVRRVEVLPYHTLGLFKWENLASPTAWMAFSRPARKRFSTLKSCFAARIIRISKVRQAVPLNAKIYFKNR